MLQFILTCFFEEQSPKDADLFAILDGAIPQCNLLCYQAPYSVSFVFVSSEMVLCPLKPLIISNNSGN